MFYLIIIWIFIEFLDYLYESYRYKKYFKSSKIDIIIPKGWNSFISKLSEDETKILNEYEIFEKFIDINIDKDVNKPWHILIIIKILLSLKQCLSILKLKRRGFIKKSNRCIDLYYLNRGNTKVIVLQHGLFAFTDNMLSIYDNINFKYDVIICIVRFVDYSYYHRYGNINDYVSIIYDTIKIYKNIKFISHSAGSIFTQHLYSHLCKTYMKNKVTKEIFIESNSLNISMIGGIAAYESIFTLLLILNKKEWNIKHFLGAYLMRGWPSLTILQSILFLEDINLAKGKIKSI